ncbi:MAG: hypothetical protein ABI723_04085 [Bacteroidia bacterium]
MATLTIETNKTYAKILAAQFRADKKIKSVEVFDDPISSYNLVRPGKPLSEKDLERIVKQAEAEPTIPIEESYIIIKKKFTSWKKGRKFLK